MTQVNNGSGGRPASEEDRARQVREMKERSRLNELTRLGEAERSRLSEIEYLKKWDEIYAAMNLDDTIEIPGKQGGEDIVIRVSVGLGGRLSDVD